ncbi:MAG: ABC-type transport auxiliary lipoprotein family protein [Alphaproteobacteria bacterium]
MIRAPNAGLRRAALAGLTAAWLAGCGSLIPGADAPPPDLYTLTPKNTFDETLPQVSNQLLVEVPIAAEGLNSHRIALSHGLLSLDYYANARWTERAPLLVQTLLVESFENTGRIVSVARDGTDLRADYVLKTELREFQAQYDDESSPPTVNVRLIAKLIKIPERSIVASESFDAMTPASGTSMIEVVGAFDEALGKVLKRLVAWSMPLIAG